MDKNNSKFVVMDNEKLNNLFNYVVRIESRCTKMMGACEGEYLFNVPDFIIGKPEDWIAIANKAHACGALTNAYTFKFQDHWLVFIATNESVVIGRFREFLHRICLICLATEEFDNSYEVLEELDAN